MRQKKRALRARGRVYMVSWPAGMGSDASVRITVSLDEGYGAENSFEIEIPRSAVQDVRSGTKLEIILIPEED